MESHMATPQHVLPTSGSQPDLLGIYLNDHLAGAAAGVALARRLAESHGDTAAADDLAWIAEQVTADRASLLKIMSQLGIVRTRYKEPLALLAERAGRLKPNGHLRSRSPLSSLVELEGMALGLEGKASAWRTLRTLADADSRFDPAMLDELIERARQQADRLERVKTRAVVEALSPREA